MTPTLKDKIADSIRISWLCKSKKLKTYLKTIEKDELFIADFAAGENDEVPYFVQNLMLSCLQIDNSIPMTVYCTDIHTLRIESLFDILVENGLEKHTRVVLSRFETMTNEARFPDIQMEYLKREEALNNQLDRFIAEKKQIPVDGFDIGFLNNDVIGYIHEYYTEYTDAEKSIQGIHKTMAPGALLIVAEPCSLWQLDNISVLEANGFKFIEGYEVEIETGMVSEISEKTDFKTMGQLGHYTVLIFETVERL